jgi:hypothetical protein
VRLSKTDAMKTASSPIKVRDRSVLFCLKDSIIGDWARL